VVLPLPGGPQKITIELARFGRASQNLTRTEQVILADEFLDLGRPHALRQGLRRLRCRDGCGANRSMILC